MYSQRRISLFVIVCGYLPESVQSQMMYMAYISQLLVLPIATKGDLFLY